MSVLVAGSANLDFVVRVAHVPAPGETVLGRALQTFPGGKGANQAIACARSGGTHCRMLLALGGDAHAAPLEASLRAAGVELHIVRSPHEPTGVALIGLSDDAENSIIVAPGANATLQPSDLPTLAGVSHLLLQLETPLDVVIAYARQAREAGVQVVLNAAPAQVLPAALLAHLDALIVNAGEFEVVTGSAIAGVQDAVRALAGLRPRGWSPAIIVTLGAEGCAARVGDEVLVEPGFGVAVVDTTAAGDTFCGALVASLSRHESWRAALRRANAAAALACTRLGAQPSIPTLAEVDRLLLGASGEQGP